MVSALLVLTVLGNAKASSGENGDLYRLARFIFYNANEARTEAKNISTIMLKHFLLPSLAASICIASSAQSPVEIPGGNNGYADLNNVPGIYMASGETQVYLKDENTDTGLYTLTLLNHDFTNKDVIQFQAPMNFSTSPNIFYNIYDMTEGRCWGEATVEFTQTLFNSDNDYEFLVPIYGSETINFITDNIYKTIGYKIVNTKGETIYTFLFPEKQYNDHGSTSVYVFSDKIVLEFDTKEDNSTQAYDYTYHTLAYAIDRNSYGANKNVTLTSDRIVVSPTLLTNREPVNVQLANTQNPCSITVFSAAGAMVYNTTAPAGINLITIPANTLPHGMNIVHITDGKSINQSTKLIIR